jgi:hypothetical protein
MRILTVLTALVMFAILGVAAYALHWDFHRHDTARQAEAVFAKAKRFRLQQTSGAEIAALGKEYRSQSTQEGSCDRDCRVIITVSDFPIRLNGKPFRLLGIRPSENRFGFIVREGKLTEFYFSQGTLLTDGTTLLFLISPDNGILLPNYPGRSTASQVLPRSSIVLERIYAPEITEADWLSIMSFNFDCTSRWRPCTKLRDYMPEAWDEYATLLRQRGGGPLFNDMSELDK